MLKAGSMLSWNSINAGIIKENYATDTMRQGFAPDLSFSGVSIGVAIFALFSGL